MGYRMIARVTLLCIAIHLQVARCGHKKNDSNHLPMVYRRSRFPVRRKEDDKFTSYSNVERRSDNIKGESTEPINKIIDKLKWFVEHKGRKDSKESGEAKESAENVGIRQVSSFADLNSEDNKNKLVDSFADVNPDGSRNKLVDFTDANSEGKKSSRSFPSDGDENNGTVTHYIEADFGKEPATLSGFLNNHKVKKLKMVLPGGHEFNLLNNYNRHASQDSSPAQYSPEEPESSDHGKSNDHNVDFKQESKENSAKEQSTQFPDTSERDSGNTRSADTKENREESKYTETSEKLDEEKAESSKNTDDVANLGIKNKADGRQHDAANSETKEKDEGSQHADDAGSSDIKEEPGGRQHADVAAIVDIKEKSGTRQHSDDAGSSDMKVKAEGGQHADESGSLNIEAKPESLNIEAKPESGPHGGSDFNKEKGEGSQKADNAGSSDMKGGQHADESGSLNIEAKPESSNIEAKPESGPDWTGTLNMKVKAGDNKQHAHADKDESSSNKEKGEGRTHNSQFPASSSKGADDLDIADMKESNDITLKNLGAIEFDGEVKMDDDDNKADGQMQAHSKSKERDSEHKMMSHDKKSDKEEHADIMTHEADHNKAEKEHSDVEHTGEHDEGQIRHELNREIGNEVQDETKKIHGGSKGVEKDEASKGMEKEVSPGTTGKEMFSGRREGKETSSESNGRKQASSEGEGRKEVPYGREGKKEPPSETEGKKEGYSEKEGKKEGYSEKEERKEYPYENEGRKGEKDDGKDDTSEIKGRKGATFEKQERKSERLEKEEKQENLEMMGEKAAPHGDHGDVNGKELLHKVNDEMSREKTHDLSDHEEQKEESSKGKTQKNKEEMSKFKNEEDSRHKQREGKHADSNHKGGHMADDETSIGKITGDAPDVVDHNDYMPHDSAGNFERPAYSDKMTPLTPTSYQPQVQSHSQDNSQRGAFMDDKNHYETGKGVEMFGLSHGCSGACAGDMHGCPLHETQEVHQQAVVPESQSYHHEAVIPEFGHLTMQGFHHETVPGLHHQGMPADYFNTMVSHSPCDHTHDNCHDSYHYHDSYFNNAMHDRPCDNIHHDCHIVHDPCTTCVHEPCAPCVHDPCTTCPPPCPEPHACKVTTSCKVKHKPDVIKVEFVPEEVSVTVGNKTKAKPINPSGKIKVQYLPGEPIIEPKAAREDAVARSNKGVMEAKDVVNEDTVENMRKERNEDESSSNEGVVGTVVLDNGRLSGVQNTGLAETNSAFYHPVAEKTKKTHKSINGYEAHPYLPFLPKPVYDQHAETRDKDQSRSDARYGVVRNVHNPADEHARAEEHAHENPVVETEHDIYSKTKNIKRAEDEPNMEGRRFPGIHGPATENTVDDFIRGDGHTKERQSGEVGIETPIHKMLEEKHVRMETTSHDMEESKPIGEQVNSPFTALSKNERDGAMSFSRYFSKLNSGYEQKPALPPFFNKKDISSTIEGHHLETETKESEPGKAPISSDKQGLHFSSSGGGPEGGSHEGGSHEGGSHEGGSHGGAPAVPAVPSMESNSEKIDPELTSLGQQYPQAVDSDIKSALTQEKSTPAGPAAEPAPSTIADPDRVFMGGGAIRPPDPSFTGGPIASPDPNPTVRPPSDPVTRGSTEINPVATHLVDAINSKSVSQEEALQMMNDFVSGNQDMTKAAKNVDGMIAQITTQRRHTPTTPDGAPSSLGSPSGLGLPDADSLTRPDEVHFFNPAAASAQFKGDDLNGNLLNPGAGNSEKVTHMFNPGASMDKTVQMFNSVSGMADKSAQMFNPGAGRSDKSAQMFNRGAGIGDKNAQMLGPGAGIGNKNAQMLGPGAGIGEKNAQMFNPGADMGDKSVQLLTSGAGIGDKNAQMLNEAAAGIDGKTSQMFNHAAGIDGKTPQMFNRILDIDGKNAQMSNPGEGFGGKTAPMFNPDAGMVDKPAFSSSESYVNKEPQMFASRNNGGNVGQNAFLSQSISKAEQGSDFNQMSAPQSFMGRNGHTSFENTQHMSPHTESTDGEFSQRGAYISQDLATGTMTRVGNQPDVVESFRTSEYENTRGKLNQGSIPETYRPAIENSFNSNLQKPISLSEGQHGSEGSYMGGKVAPAAMVNHHTGLSTADLMSNMEMPGSSSGVDHMREVGSTNHMSLPESPSMRGNSNSETATLMRMMQGGNMQKHGSGMHFYEGVSSNRPSVLGRSMQSFMGSRYGEAEAELPQGHIIPMSQEESSKPIGLPDNSEMTSGYSRKFRTPHVEDQPKKSVSKPVSGSRKNNVIADMYADSVFPEDINDIDSLQASLQGKTLTNYDKGS